MTFSLFATIGVRIALDGLIPAFEAATGHAIAASWATAPMLVRRIRAGERPDVMILNQAGIDAMAAEQRIAPASAVPVASSGVAIAVRAGDPHPDIATPQALRATLLAARSIACTDPEAGGASGIHFAKLLQQMGIAAEIRLKIIYPPAGGFAGNLLLTGQADLAIQQAPELLHVPGTAIVGPLPDPLNVITTFVAGIATGTAHHAAAAAFIGFLQTPAAVAVFAAKGLGLA